MSDPLTEDDWQQLIKRIESKACTPFLGAGVNAPLLSMGAGIAKKWASEEGYPLIDNQDLARVAQFISLKAPDKLKPKELMKELLEGEIRKAFRVDKANFVAPNHHLGKLAALPLPVFITTNYDDLLFRALRANQKDPQVEVCPWNLLLKKNSLAQYPAMSDSEIETVEPTGFGASRLTSQSKYNPTVANPLIYHIHGHYKSIDSMVLTENDYLDFLVEMSRNQKLLPIKITRALTQSSVLFIGYSLNDPNFRVLFRGLIHPLAENRRLSVAIQLLPSDIAESDKPAAQAYLTRYFEDIKIKVFWGSAEQFIDTLSDRWNNRNKP
jgi:hypothetical protein